MSFNPNYPMAPLIPSSDDATTSFVSLFQADALVIPPPVPIFNNNLLYDPTGISGMIVLGGTGSSSGSLIVLNGSTGNLYCSNINVNGTVTGLTLTDGVFSTTNGVITGATITSLSDNVAANSLKTLTNLVNVSNSTAPASTYVIIATSPTSATWQPQSALTGVPSVGKLYANFYNIVTTNLSVAKGATVPFVTSGPAGNGTITPVSSGLGNGFQVPNSGNYQITFNVNSATTPTQIVLRIN